MLDVVLSVNIQQYMFMNETDIGRQCKSVTLAEINVTGYMYLSVHVFECVNSVNVFLYIALRCYDVRRTCGSTLKL